MKKLMIAFAAIAAFVSVASAEDAWFTGTIGGEAGGSWTMAPGDGEITTNNTTLALEDAAASFVATSPKSLSGSENLKFATSAKFRFSYDKLPEIDSGAKAGIVVYTNEYYVLAKDGTTNNWAATGIAAVSLDSEVAVNVTISKDIAAVFAIYNIAGSVITKEVVAGDSAWGTVDYKGSGEVASLVGTTISLGYPIGPGHDPIPTDVGDGWAEEHGIAPDKIAEVLASTQTYKGGRTAAESCLLGVGTNDDIKAEVADNSATKLDFTVKCSPISGRVKFALVKDGVAGTKQDTVNFEVAIADGKYQIVAYIDGAETSVPASQEIGVKGTSVAASTVYFIGAPWDDCAITDLFKKTCCKQGDKVEVYDATTDSYKSWMLKASGEWEFATGQGDEPVLIRKGQAVKYTTADVTKLYQVGEVTEENTTPIVKGKWNLVASPKGSIAATALLLDTADQAIQLNASGTAVAKTYLKYGDDVKYRVGYKGPWITATEEIKVTDAFFVKPEKAEAVNW